jgi:hypothetical protein
MPDITVRRHGDRWAVLEAGAESPTKEFETREAAELAARGMAGGGTVAVSEDDPTGLDQARAQPAAAEPGGPGGVNAQERARSTQGGL